MSQVGTAQERLKLLTVSNPLPVKILSVVAATLPPFRCRSHIISLRFNCGNICDICSTCAGSTLLPRCCSRFKPPESLDDRDERSHRITRKETTASVRREGRLNDGSTSAMYYAWEGGCSREDGEEFGVLRGLDIGLKVDVTDAVAAEDRVGLGRGV
jgi:hypothetical protein